MCPISKLDNKEYESGKSAQPGGFPAGVAPAGKVSVCGDSLCQGHSVLWECEKSYCHLC